MLELGLLHGRECPLRKAAIAGERSFPLLSVLGGHRYLGLKAGGRLLRPDRSFAWLKASVALPRASAFCEIQPN